MKTARFCFGSVPALAVLALFAVSCGKTLADGARNETQPAPLIAPKPAPATPPASTQTDSGRIHVFVSGKVQGVGFRDFTRAQARSLNLTGWVKNLPDGRVELVAEGNREQLKKLLEAVSKGPPAARVDKIEVQEEPFASEFSTFEVVR